MSDAKMFDVPVIENEFQDALLARVLLDYFQAAREAGHIPSPSCSECVNTVNEYVELAQRNELRSGVV